MASDPAHSELDFLRQTYDAASLMAREGEYELALRLVRAAIERADRSPQAGRTVDVEADATRADLERQLAASYTAYRARIDDGRKPWQEALARTAIITSGVALTFIVCAGFAIWRVDALIASPVDKVVAVLDGAVKSELPRVTNRVVEAVPEVSAQVNREIQNTSLRFSDYLDKKVDQALDARIAAIVDEKIRARLDKK